MDKVKNKWNEIFMSQGNQIPKIDDWLDKYLIKIEAYEDVKIIDLGCGFGNDTYYLSNKGYDIISCDYSIKALDILSNFIENPNTKLFDIREKLPFIDNYASVIICDLSLHYFDETTTFNIIKELKRVLIDEGMLIVRVNSLKEIDNENLQPNIIDNHFYKVGVKAKRYFDNEDICRFFGDFEICDIHEYIMTRYGDDKFVLDFCCVNRG